MTEKLIENFYCFDCWESESMSFYGKKLLDKIFKNSSDSKFAVYLHHINDAGIISSEELFIYDSYINALEKINKYEYSNNVAVDVYEINPIGYASVLSKCFNGVGYSRYAHVEFQHYSLSDMRKLYDGSALVYDCYLLNN